MAIRNINEPSSGAVFNQQNVLRRFNGEMQPPEVDDDNYAQLLKSENYKKHLRFIATNTADCDIAEIKGTIEESTERYNKSFGDTKTNITKHKESNYQRLKRLSKILSENKQISLRYNDIKIDKNGPFQNISVQNIFDIQRSTKSIINVIAPTGTGKTMLIDAAKVYRTNTVAFISYSINKTAVDNIETASVFFSEFDALIEDAGYHLFNYMPIKNIRPEDNSTDYANIGDVADLVDYMARDVISLLQNDPQHAAIFVDEADLILSDMGSTVNRVALSYIKLAIFKEVAKVLPVIFLSAHSLPASVNKMFDIGTILMESPTSVRIKDHVVVMHSNHISDHIKLCENLHNGLLPADIKNYNYHKPIAGAEKRSVVCVSYKYTMRMIDHINELVKAGYSCYVVVGYFKTDSANDRTLEKFKECGATLIYDFDHNAENPSKFVVNVQHAEINTDTYLKGNPLQFRDGTSVTDLFDFVFVPNTATRAISVFNAKRPITVYNMTDASDGIQMAGRFRDRTDTMLVQGPIFSTVNNNAARGSYKHALQSLTPAHSAINFLVGEIASTLFALLYAIALDKNMAGLMEDPTYSKFKEMVLRGDDVPAIFEAELKANKITADSVYSALEAVGLNKIVVRTWVMTDAHVKNKSKYNALVDLKTIESFTEGCACEFNKVGKVVKKNVRVNDINLAELLRLIESVNSAWNVGLKGCKVDMIPVEVGRLFTTANGPIDTSQLEIDNKKIFSASTVIISNPIGPGYTVTTVGKAIGKKASTKTLAEREFFENHYKTMARGTYKDVIALAAENGITVTTSSAIRWLKRAKTRVAEESA